MKKGSIFKSPYIIILSTLIFPMYYFPYYITEIVEANKITYSISLIYLVTTYFFLLWSDYLILFNKERVRPIIFKINMYLKFFTLVLSVIYTTLFFFVVFMDFTYQGASRVVQMEALILTISLISTLLLWNSISYFKSKYVSK